MNKCRRLECILKQHVGNSKSKMKTKMSTNYHPDRTTDQPTFMKPCQIWCYGMFHCAQFEQCRANSVHHNLKLDTVFLEMPFHLVHYLILNLKYLQLLFWVCSLFFLQPFYIGRCTVKNCVVLIAIFTFCIKWKWNEWKRI